MLVSNNLPFIAALHRACTATRGRTSGRQSTCYHCFYNDKMRGNYNDNMNAHQKTIRFTLSSYPKAGLDYKIYDLFNKVVRYIRLGSPSRLLVRCSTALQSTVKHIATNQTMRKVYFTSEFLCHSFVLIGLVWK